MVPAVKDTQQGATITLAGDGLSLRITKIDPLTAVYGEIDTTTLSASTKRTWTVAELANFKDIAVEYQNSPGLANPTPAAQTVTITGPTASGASVPESATGTAFIKEVPYLPGFSSASEGLQMKTFILKFDGETGPTRTVSS
jgi:hypothetical protein